ncbi:lysozyme-like isoform X2 [Pectinophora gossypiella]|uniref:lysozyme-like isoform X2 n=1 Tax=Pectinophora gossypiella TaxID=13191 RepID=UPI00214E9430|nr:lysozyme-like isoform X2 [Pectinophora gossypiella]
MHSRRRHSNFVANLRVCLVEAESSRRTDAVGGPDDDGSYDYGLFQINDRYWCNSGDKPGKECHVRCADLLSDDISAASNCTKKIYNIQGFSAWVGWVNECNKKKLQDLSDCIL